MEIHNTELTVWVVVTAEMTVWVLTLTLSLVRMIVTVEAGAVVVEIRSRGRRTRHG